MAKDELFIHCDHDPVNRLEDVGIIPVLVFPHAGQRCYETSKLR